jgi:hypothetical protein
MMKSLLLALAAITFLCSLHTEPAQAQRLFVSATGSDSNPCTFALPCRSFQHAHDVTSANGEIDVLDPAGYGAVTITKAISIQGHGFSGVSVPSNGIGITINAPATGAVHLNGLLIEGGRLGSAGIKFNTGKLLAVENCIVRNMLGEGLRFAPTASTALAVSNSYFNDNASGGIFILTPISAGSITVTVAIDRTGFNGNSDGLTASNASTGPLTIAVTDSVVANNTQHGFFINSNTSNFVTNLSLSHVLVEGNEVGVVAEENATLWLAQSTVTGNTLQGFFVNTGAVINSFGDNYFGNNGPNVGSLTSVSKQ